MPKPSRISKGYVQSKIGIKILVYVSLSQLRSALRKAPPVGKGTRPSFSLHRMAFLPLHSEPCPHFWPPIGLWFRGYRKGKVSMWPEHSYTSSTVLTWVLHSGLGRCLKLPPIVFRAFSQGLSPLPCPHWVSLTYSSLGKGNCIVLWAGHLPGS